MQHQTRNKEKLSDKSQYLLSCVYEIQFDCYKGKTESVPGRQSHSEKFILII